MGTKRSTGVGLHVEGAEKFRADLKKANSAIKQTNAEVKKLDATYGKGSKESDYLTQRTKALTTQLDSQRKKTAALKGTLDSYQASGKATTAQVERYRLEILKSETAEAQLTREIREANDALRAQKISMEDITKGLDTFSQKSGKVGSALTKALTLPIAGMGTYTLNAAMELEDAMKTVQTLPGVTSGSIEQRAEQLEAYTEAILNVSNATHTAAEDLAMAQYSAISAGVAAEESVKVVERSAKAAKAGLSDVGTVIDGATSSLNAWGAAAGGIDHVLDAMMVTQNEGKTTIGDLASNIGQVTGLAPQLGVALDEVLAAVAALTKGGVQTSSAINGLKAVFSNVMKPTAEAREEAARLGLQFDATALQAQGFTGFLESVMDATQGDSESLAKLFGSVEGLAQIMALGTTQAEEYARILVEVENSAGAVDEAFAVRTSSKAEKLAGSLNKLRNSGSELAENLFPAVDAVTGLVGGVAEIVGDMDEGTQKAMVSILGVTAAIGPTVKAVSSLTGAVAKLIPLLSGPWGLAAAGAVLVGGLVIDLATAGTSAKQLEKTIEEMELTPDATMLTSLTGRIQAAIDAVDGEKIVSVKANVASDFSALEGLTEEISGTLTRRLDNAMADYWLTWKEYAAFTEFLNSDNVMGVAEIGLQSQDREVSSVAQELSAAIEAAEALLWTVFASGDSVTEREIAQLHELMGQISDYRAQLLAAHGEAEQVVSVISREIESAMEDNRLELQEYEAIKRMIDEEVRPDAVAAMEDAATASIGSELDSALTEFEGLLDAIMDRGGDVAEDEIARIDGLLTEIENLHIRMETMQGFNDAVNAELAENAAVQITVAGYGTDDTAAEAAGAVEGWRRWQQSQVDEEEERIKEQYKVDQAAAMAEAEKQTLKEKYVEDLAALEAARDSVDANAQENLNEIFEGWLKGESKYQQEALKIGEIGALVEAYSSLKIGEDVGKMLRFLYDSGMLTQGNWDLGNTWAHMYGLIDAEGVMLPYEDVMAMYSGDEWFAKDLNALIHGAHEEIQERLKTAMEEYDGENSPLIAMYQAWLDTGINVNELDVTHAEGTLADLMRLLLLKEQGIDALGSEAMEAIGSGIVEAVPEVVEDAEEAAEKIGAAATSLTSGAAAGAGLARTLAAGIIAGTPAAVAAARALAAQVAAELDGAFTYSPGTAVAPAGAGVGAGLDTNSYDFSTNITFGTGVFTAMNDVNAMAERLNTLNRLKMAGIGTIMHG